MANVSGSLPPSATTSSCHASNETDEDKKILLWQFVIKLDGKISKGGDNIPFECKKCKEIKGIHILECELIY